jgi:hypothetical protein
MYRTNVPSSRRQVGSMPPAGVIADQIVITEKFNQAIRAPLKCRNRARWFRTSEATLRAAQ